ncbi:MAG: hypothetical protein ACPLUL_00360 [Thermanaerothrix sp.]|uniref:hypothetical protein n=1 Tax=Thermanaerothrix sp. TaxID=2972675 RepID=UPI003C7B57C4
MRKKKGALKPLSFRLYADEREALKRLAQRWGVKQVAVIRRLLAEAAREAQDGQPK